LSAVLAHHNGSADMTVSGCAAISFVLQSRKFCDNTKLFNLSILLFLRSSDVASSTRDNLGKSRALLIGSAKDAPTKCTIHEHYYHDK